MASQARSQTRQRTRRPPQVQVLLLNDDYTPMDFVIALLRQLFHQPPAQAYATMLEAHRQGVSVAGVYPYEIAETKRQQAEQLARRSGYPLRLALQPLD